MEVNVILFFISFAANIIIYPISTIYDNSTYDIVHKYYCNFYDLTFIPW